MPNKVSIQEPAERPYTIDLSHAEVLVLVNHHVRTTKRIPTQLGKHLAARSSAFRPNKRLLDRFIQEAQTQIDAHANRARGLLSILKQ